MIAYISFIITIVLIPRREYDHYCRWASKQLPDCRFGENVSHVEYDAKLDKFIIESESASGENKIYKPKSGNWYWD